MDFYLKEERIASVKRSTSSSNPSRRLFSDRDVVGSAGGIGKIGTKRPSAQGSLFSRRRRLTHGNKTSKRERER